MFSQPPRTLNVILLDVLNTTIPNQLYAKQQMLKYLETMPADQPTAVYMLTRNLRMLQDFTSDPNVLKEAINRLRGYRSAALDNPTGGQDKDPIVAPGAAAFIPAEILQAMEDSEEERSNLQLDQRIKLNIAVLHEMAKTLAGYPGRKNLIWVSEGFPLHIFSKRTMQDYTEQVQKAEDALSDSQVAVYPIDAAGLVAFGMDASTAGLDNRGKPLNMGSVMQQQSASMIDNHFAMNEVAGRTGGKAFYNRNDLDTAIKNSMTDGSTYYMIGYYPSDKNWNGKFRKIEVKVGRAGVELRYRAGYFATDKQTYVKDRKARELDVADALDLANPAATALFFTAALTPPSAQTPNKLVVKYNIDVHSIAFEQGDDGLQHADVTCWLRAFSEQGKPLKMTNQTTVASLKPDTYQRIMKTAFPCTAEMELPAGKYLLRFAVRDEHTGLVGTANGKVTIP